jgi:ATP-dependent DNA helicase DinG
MSVDRERLLADTERMLGPDGILERRLDGFEHRPAQLEMARLVAESIADGASAVLEGGTGIGKTLAYLIPALLSGRKVVVATGTKTLQEQIFFKDLPNLLKAVELPIRATYMKGRANYLCLLRYNQFSAQRLFRFAADAPLYERIEEWAEHTDTGDRAELADLPDDYGTWPELTSSSENCLGTRCRLYNECFVTRMRRRAQDADLVIVNHHLYMADLSIREKDFGEVIPSHEIAIFDEAHLLESVATSYFGVSMSVWRVLALNDDLLRWMDPKLALKTGMHKILEELKADTIALFDFFRYMQGRFRLKPQHVDQAVLQALDPVVDHLDLLMRKLSALAKEGREEADGYIERAAQIGRDLDHLLVKRPEEYVYWGEAKKRGVVLNASPLDVAPILRQTLFARPVASIFTSATLATGSSFFWFKERIGLPDDAREAVFESPFDYRHQTTLFLPRVMPEPQSEQFVPRAAELIAQLVQISEGSALVLFTSYANMEGVYARLKDRLPYPLLKQGDAPRNLLLEMFRERVDSVLFATGTFWQGVDVLGESLRLVIIDKLPFESPGDPVTEARIEFLKNSGKNPFFDYQVPAAIIQLKQGVGRLIRSAEDWGAIAILDRRLKTKGYGKKFLEALPASIRTEQLDQVRSWWRTRKSISGLH